MADWIINRPKATITCSKCKARLNAKLFMDLLEAWNFCPYCGEDMRAEQTEPQTMVYPQVDGITPSVIEPQTEREGE